MKPDPLADEHRDTDDLIAALASLAPGAARKAVRDRMRQILDELDRRPGLRD